MDSMEIPHWLKVGYEKAGGRNGPLLVMEKAADQDDS